MHTKESLILQLKNMGLKPTDTVFVHSSYKAVAGEEGVEGGPSTIVEAFIEYFGKEGLVVFPAMSWKLGYLINDQGQTRNPALGPEEGYFEYGNHFDVKTTTCDYLGIIPELFRQREGVIRSVCPTSSVAAFGKDAKEFCSGHENAETPLHWNSPWGKLYDRDAKILFLGTTMSCNTFMHVIEEYANVPNLLPDYIWKYTATDYEGKEHIIEFKRHEPGHNWYYIKVQDELMEKGIAQKVVFGSADTHLVNVRKETEYMLEKLKENPLLFTHEYNKN